MVVQGHPNTLPVTLDEMIYHAEMVGRAVQHALVVVDMPFPSYHLGVLQGDRKRRPHSQGNPLPGRQAGRGRRAGRGDRGAGVGRHSGDGPLRTAAAERAPAGRLQGAARRGATAGRRRARPKQAGAFAMVLECIPVDRGRQDHRSGFRFPRSASAPARRCDGQVLVINDLLGTDQRLRAAVRQSLRRSARRLSRKR